MIKKIWISLLLAFTGIVISIPNHSYALTNLPDQYIIDYAYGYTGLAETGDIFVLVKFHVSYTVYPDDPVSSTWLFRLMDGTTELVNAVPFNNPYFHNGYGYQVVGLYLSASDAVSVNATYGGNYTAYLVANPSISWNGTVPNPTNKNVTWIPQTSFFGTATNMRSDLRTKILAAASDFRTRWSLTFNLSESGYLTADGENYFTGAIPNLRIICPEVFSSFMTSPSYHRRTFNLSYALTLRNQWVGTWLDLSQPAIDWSIDAIWLYGGLWCIALFAALWGVAVISNSNKGLYWVATMGVGVGAFIGFLPWVALGIDAFIAVIIIVNEMLYKRSPS